ncbi:hypothetical protein PVAP13_8NG065001 [Panicum virgatum]|uniref:Secreted protein n=1 Tax=Panicum virgatum TaxID=38727 RepID=A0A8T0P9W9_PANVG|nr:hypothetical protein PVAP13_8NG065001 [Panicum virgatum]
MRGESPSIFICVGAMLIAIYFSGCVENACTAMRQTTSPPHQTNGPKQRCIQRADVLGGRYSRQQR